MAMKQTNVIRVTTCNLVMWRLTRVRGLVWVAIESIADVDAKSQEKVLVVDHASVVEVVALIQPKQFSKTVHVHVLL